MNVKKDFLKIAKIALILVYLVIVAGAVVRMTGSGMGCPDWPKCFGYYIPPTEEAQLQWHPNKAYQKGQVIIVDKSLQVAALDFTTTTNFTNENWHAYTKHEYAIFNPWHTWIEFLNRLVGALAGLATLVLAIRSIKLWKTNKMGTILSWVIVVAMGFQAWLGATVVYSVLNPFKITIHMVMALLIVALLLYLIAMSSSNKTTSKYDKTLSKLLSAALIVTLVQVVLGTQVREFIDGQIDIMGASAKNLWLQYPTVQFYVHRSFSIMIVALNLFIAYRIYTLRTGHYKITWVLLLIFLEVSTGMAMYYFDFPLATQPIHLVLASLLFGVQFYLVLELLKSKRNHKTL